MEFYAVGDGLPDDEDAAVIAFGAELFCHVDGHHFEGQDGGFFALATCVDDGRAGEWWSVGGYRLQGVTHWSPLLPPG